MTAPPPWLRPFSELPASRRALLAVLAFVVPLALWCLVSYVPFIWHPMVRVSDAGDVGWVTAGEVVEGDALRAENVAVAARGGRVARGTPANPVFLPAPHQVARALFTGFVTPPARPDEPWLHEALLHSISIIFWGFLLSSLIGVPLGIACGALPAAARLTEPFIEFFRYLPAPAFGALAVAVLGINDAPKIAIIFIGTFFQQVLVVANTTRRLDVGLLEAAQTLGATPRQLLLRVVVPGIITDLYADMRVLLGWAWTYLIVAELIGVSSGITYFINQQAKYRAYDRVFASIILIGLIGLGTDLVLASIGRQIFPWQRTARTGWFSRAVRLAARRGRPAAAGTDARTAATDDEEAAPGVVGG